MSNIAPPTEAVNTPPEYFVGPDLERAIVRATFDQSDWERTVDAIGPAALALTLKKVIKDIGDQEQRWMYGLSEARTDVDVSDDEYDLRKRNFARWKRSTSEVRQAVRKRLKEIQPIAQRLHDEHQADRRSLSILARRLWLWEEGLDDHLDDALDDWTISGSVGDPTHPRTTLREHVMDILARNGEVTP